MSELKGPIEKYNHVGHVIKNVNMAHLVRQDKLIMMLMEKLEVDKAKFENGGAGSS